MELNKSVILILVAIVLGLVLFTAINSVSDQLIIGKTTSRGSCYDTDLGGKDEKFLKGTISGVQDNGQEFERTDYCIDGYQLKEYHCQTEHNLLNFVSTKEYCDNGCLISSCIG